MRSKSSRRLSRRQLGDHLAHFPSGAISYTYTFDVGTAVSHRDLANRLLKNEIAEAGLAAGTTDIPLGRQFEGLKKVRDLADTYDTLRKLRDGEIALNELPFLERQRIRAIVGKARLANAIKKPGENVEQDDGEPDARVKEARRLIEDHVKDLRAFSIARAAVDGDLYRSSYLAEVPYFRMSLASFYAKQFSPPLSEANVEEPIEVELLIHRSGVALLTFHFMYPAGLTADDLSLIGRSNRVHFSEARVPVPTVRAFCEYQGESFEQFKDKITHEAGSPDRVHTVFAEPISLDDIFNVYQGAVLQFSGTPRSPSWFCFPTIFVPGLLCCHTRQNWLNTHQSELFALINGVPIPVNKAFSRDLDSLTDFGLTPDSSFYATGGLAVEVDWKFAQIAPVEAVPMFMRLTVVEYGLLRYWQVRCVEASIDLTNVDEAKVTRTWSEFSFEMDEVRRPQLSYGTANDIATHIYNEAGGPKNYDAAREKLDALRDLLAAHTSRKSNRRSARLAAGAILGAILLGLPAIRQSLDILKNVPVVTAFGREVLEFFPKTSLDSLAVIAYAAFLLLALLITIGRRSRLQVRKRRLKRLAGISWEERGSVRHIELSENRPHGSSQRKPTE